MWGDSFFQPTTRRSYERQFSVGTLPYAARYCVAMSQENIEVVRRVYKLTEARGVEGLLELATDDIVWISDPRFPGGGRHNGKENVAAG